MRLLLASAALLWLSAAAAETVEVQLQQGAIVGSRSEAKGGRAFYGFLGIPFAQPPVGALRFKDPVAAGAWEGVRNGTVAPPLCPQPDAPSDWMQEDCLYLSVFTPQPNRTDLPVMVWLPQGGFISDATPLFQPEFLLAKDVVLVVLQHRLGVLGFLSTEDAELPGNLGLKDQAMALRWVQDNIRDLGGDPDKVTIFGQNAGGAAVHYHMLSPMSSGLFQRAIMQSGAALCPWALREDHRQVAFGFGRMVGCPGDRADAANSTALVDCLRDVPVEQLMAVTPYITPSPYVLTPRVDGEFLPAHPATLVREGRYNRVDVLSGVTRDEGAFNARAFVEDGVMDSMIQNFSLVGPPALGFEAWDDDPEYLARLAFHRYLGPMEFDLTRIDPLVKLLGDSFYSMCHVEAVEHHARDAAFGFRAFAYELQHRGEHAFSDLFRGPSPAWNLAYVGDSDDLQYLFSFDKLNVSLTKEEDLFVSRIMVDLWTNFAATGNPTPDLSLGFKWTPTEASSLSYLGITSAPAMKVYDREQDIEFWRNLPRKMNKLLYPDRFSQNSN
nr:cholinesterase 1-like [Penaeus vannamei]XP_027216596.1 cholinesterase 1-like [Penaeus vannamei]